MKTPKPLGIHSIIANSIVDYLLENLQIDEPIEAYNDWIQTEAIPRHFPMSEIEYVMFALNLFEVCIHICDEGSLRCCKEIEDAAALQMCRVS